jgi:aryl-alcohol dehydrogenase-like predicted oxidoreductase
VLNKKGITSIVAGTSSLEQFDQNLKAVGIKLIQEELDACDEVWNHLRPPRLFYGR